jgi:hypothetical protein
VARDVVRYTHPLTLLVGSYAKYASGRLVLVLIPANLLLFVQIISLQTLHYLTLSIITPPLLAGLTSPSLLTYSGGPSTVSHILDWREMAGRPTISSSSFSHLSATLDSAADGWRKLRGAWAGGKQVGTVEGEEGIGVGQKAGVGVDEEMEEVWDFGVDDRRGWLIGLAWLAASAIE